MANTIIATSPFSCASMPCRAAWRRPLSASVSPSRSSAGWHSSTARKTSDVLAYLRLLLNPRDDLSFLRAVNEPPRGIGKVSLEHLARYAEPRELSLLAAAAQVDKIPAIKGKASLGLRTFAGDDGRTCVRSSMPRPTKSSARCSTARGYRGMLKDSTRRRGPGTPGQHRGTHHRRQAVPCRKTAAGPSATFWKTSRWPATSTAGTRSRTGVGDDVARGQGAGVPGGLHRRDRTGHPAARTQPGQGRGPRGRTPARVRRASRAPRKNCTFATPASGSSAAKRCTPCPACSWRNCRPKASRTLTCRTPAPLGHKNVGEPLRTWVPQPGTMLAFHCPHRPKTSPPPAPRPSAPSAIARACWSITISMVAAALPRSAAMVP